MFLNRFFLFYLRYPNSQLNMNLHNANTVNESKIKSASALVNPPLAGALNALIESNAPQSASLPNANNTIKQQVPTQVRNVTTMARLGLHSNVFRVRNAPEK
mmetsp:Transcript_26014/g.47167  ORF Transcript_26014/g.47167 Transcript_26014/m.47167 type:complete len:102 (-) Transcript_26014:688-993(-)